MLTSTAPLRHSALQSLIDARLDTIDRMLLGRLPRADRLAIVEEVETQIGELIAKQAGEPQTREEILEILEQLDPPEAYLPEEGTLFSSPQASVSASPLKTNGPTKSQTKLGLIGGWIGIGSLCLFPAVASFPLIVAVLTNSEILTYFAISLLVLFGFVGFASGLTLSLLGRKDGLFPILGMVFSPLTLLFSIFASVCYYVNL